MPLNFFKKGLRALGISESFVKGRSTRAVLAGVVMRRDLVIDGFSFSSTTVGGMDSTEKVSELYRGLERKDVNVLLLNGCVISMFNIVDLRELYAQLSVPLICVSYEESPGLEKYLEELPDSQERIHAYRKLGAREELTLRNGHRVYLRYEGVERQEAKKVLELFTLQGKLPEPLRVARLLARALCRQKFLNH